ncbi:MAG: hypothetical protein VX610_06175 [SAR324 cluster bacterium]|nr:hypothetical protein [SAR324 cluster bacterium]
MVLVRFPKPVGADFRKVRKALPAGHQFLSALLNQFLQMLPVGAEFVLDLHPAGHVPDHTGHAHDVPGLVLVEPHVGGAVPDAAVLALERIDEVRDLPVLLEPLEQFHPRLRTHVHLLGHLHAERLLDRVARKPLDRSGDVGDLTLQVRAVEQIRGGFH